MKKNELTRYMGTSRGWLITAIVWACFASGFVLMANALDKMEPSTFWLILLLEQWPVIVLLIVYFCKRHRVRRIISQLERENRLDTILSDFQSAARMVNDKLRLGRHYIYVRGKKKLLPYSDIHGLHQVIESSGILETSRKLMYQTPSGKEVELCKLESHGISNEDVKKIRLFVAIMQKEENAK